MTDKVSILMPVKNGAPYLKEAINSIINQSYKRWELIVVNDASTDDTEKILQEYADERIKVITNKKNLGVANSLNEAIKIASGKYFARMDSDDVSMRLRIEKQLKFLIRNPSIDLCGTGVYLIDSDGKIIGQKSYISTPSKIKSALPFYNPIIHPTFMGRKSLLITSGGYNSNYDGAEDYDLLLKLINEAKFANLQAKLLKFRLHKESVSTTNMRRMDNLDLKLKINYLKKHPLNLKLTLRILRKIILIYLIPLKLKLKVINMLRGFSNG